MAFKANKKFSSTREAHTSTRPKAECEAPGFPGAKLTNNHEASFPPTRQNCNLQYLHSFSTFLILSTLVSTMVGCQQSSNNSHLGVNILGPNLASEQQKYYEIYQNRQKTFDDAYASANTFFAPENKVAGAIIATNLGHKEALAGFFNSLSKNQHYDTIVVIGSTDFVSPPSPAPSPVTPSSVTPSPVTPSSVSSSVTPSPPTSAFPQPSSPTLSPSTSSVPLSLSSPPAPSLTTPSVPPSLFPPSPALPVSPSVQSSNNSSRPPSPSAKNSVRPFNIFITSSNVKTPYGLLSTDQVLIQKMLEQKSAQEVENTSPKTRPLNQLKNSSKTPSELNLSVQNAQSQEVENLFSRAHSLNVLAPFIKKSFPQSHYLPILINEKAGAEELELLAKFLKENLGTNSLVLAQTILKTSSDENLKMFQLKFTKNVLENFDFPRFADLPVDQTSTIQVLQLFLGGSRAPALGKSEGPGVSKSQSVRTPLLDEQKPALIQYFSEGPLATSRNIFLVSFGDIMLDRGVRSLMNKNSLDYPFQKMDESYLKSNDILLANLEGPIAKKAIITSKSIAFRFLPDVMPLLKKYHFDVVSLANNHAFDMGMPGYNDSKELLQQGGMKAFGNPKEIEEGSVATFQEGDRKIAFLGLEEVVFKIDTQKAINRVKELTAQGYQVIPFIHWGIEYTHKPNQRQQNLAHSLIDAGAVALIAHHPHVVQSYETYKNRPIFYSLGNAVFDQYFSVDTQEGLSLALNISSDQLEIYFLPIKIDRSQMQLMNADERQVFLQKFVTYGDYSEAEKQNILKGILTLSLQ